MTLASALPWRACAPLGRARRISLLSLVSLRSAGSRSFSRAQPRDNAAAALSAHTPPGDDASPNTAPAEASAPDAPPLSFSERLDRTPVRHHGQSIPVIVGAVTRLPHAREAHEELQRYHRNLTQQARVEKHRKGEQPGDWRLILQNLITWTPTYETPRDGVKLIIPKDSVELLLSDFDNNVWNIKSRTGCEMTLYKPTGNEVILDGERGSEGEDDDEGEGKDAKAYVILGGQPPAINAAVDDIIKVVKSVTVVNVQGGSERVLQEEGMSMTQDELAFAEQIRVSHYQMGNPEHYALKIRADQILRPKRWTLRTFEEHVAALTTGRLYGSLAQKLYPPPGEKHNIVVVQQLHDLFNNPEASAAVSIPALKLALHYLVRSGEANVNDAQALVDRVETLGLRLDTNVYNYMAETAVYSKNLLAFQSILQKMISRGHQPNLRTWILFLRMVAAEEVKRYVLHAMDTKNYFADPSAVVCVSRDMADHDAYRAIQTGQDTDAFLSGLRELYGPHWRLTTRAACRFLDLFGRHGRFKESRRLLEIMFETEKARPNTVALNTVLSHCKVQGKYFHAVAFVRMFEERGCGGHVDVLTFRLLFELARRKMRPHLLSAVWRYAHLTGMTNHRMRKQGIRLLAGEAEAERLTSLLRGLWESPNNASLTRQQFIEALLLCDYKGVFAEECMHVPLNKQKGPGGRQGRDAAPVVALWKGHADVVSETSGASSDGPSETAPEIRPVITAAASFARSLETFSDNPSERAVEDTLPKRTPPAIQKKYNLFRHWTLETAKELMPAIPFGEFLQQAFDRERKLFDVAKRRQGPMQRGLLIDMRPLELPVTARWKGSKPMMNKPVSRDVGGRGKTGIAREEGVRRLDALAMGKLRFRKTHGAGERSAMRSRSGRALNRLKRRKRSKNQN